MSSMTNDLEDAYRFLLDSYASAKNAVVLLERVSPNLAEEGIGVLSALDDARDRVRRASRALESV